MVISLFSISCEKRIGIGTPIPQIYQLYIQFIDHEGENLLKDIPIEKLKNYIEVLADKEGNNILYPVKYVKHEEKQYLSIQASSMPGISLGEINYTIKSKEIFGDEELHFIKSTWIRYKNNALPEWL